MRVSVSLHLCQHLLFSILKIVAILLGMMWYLLWFWIAFPWWLLMSIFSCTYNPFICLPWRNVYSSPLLISIRMFVFLLLSISFNILQDIKPSSNIWSTNVFSHMWVIFFPHFFPPKCLFRFLHLLFFTETFYFSIYVKSSRFLIGAPFFFCHATWLAGSQFHDQCLNLSHDSKKSRILATRSPGNFQNSLKLAWG